MGLITDLETIKNAKKHASDPDRAICIKIAVGGDMFITYWIDNNEHILECLEKEKILIEKQLRKQKLDNLT